MPTLYRCNTPTNWLCPCGSVARALERAGLPFDEVKLPQMRTKRPEVEELTDQQRVPVLVIDGQAICDSRRIIEYLAYRQIADQEPEPPPPTPQPVKQRLWQ
jgi:glutathione S-transferase